MIDPHPSERYSFIDDKNPREIILLRGYGCRWRRCRFCNYHLDFSHDQKANDVLNFSVMDEVQGKTGVLEMINSGSFCDLSEASLEKLIDTCKRKHIHQLHVECHWIERAQIAPFRARLAREGITLKVKGGVETFDGKFREAVFDKGIPAETTPAEIAQYFNECCLLFGVHGETLAQMQGDIDAGLANFDRICINIMIDNGTPVKRDESVVNLFMTQLYDKVKNNPRVDVLLNNTDFGVG
ncbi:MAG: radical SAM protein [Peptococcaceae bacterium]|nr:radical SAM protein [Peptococcaceae bacterium]